jgi:phosphatidylglycerol---prolipoprotein diacylglyceryl transferase
MYQILFQIGPITVYSLWVFIGIGFFAALLIINRLAKKNRLKLQFLADNSLAIFFGGLVLARIFFVARNYQLYFSDVSFGNLIQVFYLWDKGLSVWGGILGIILGFVYFCKKCGENTLKWLDIVVISILGALALGHIGAFLDGRNFGNETNLPWGVIIDNSLYAVPIHPTQIYAALYTGILAFVLTKLLNKNIGKKEGNISILALTAYSALRFLEEFLRGDESNIILGLREAQIYALIGMLAGGILWYVRIKKSSSRSSKPPGELTL